MIREDVIEFLQICLIILDGGQRKDYPQFAPDLWIMGEKQMKYMGKLQVAL